MAKTDAGTLGALVKRDARWRKRFDSLEESFKQELLKVFGPATAKRRSLIESALLRLEVSDAGVILDSRANENVLVELLGDVGKLNVKAYGKGGKLSKTIDPGMSQAARMGVRHALDAIRIGEPSSLPGKAFRGSASMALVDGASKLVVDAVRSTSERDLDNLRQAFLRRIGDPEGTTDALRRDLAASGQLEGMLDSAGRRITVDERADRIAKYELNKLSQESHEAAVGEVYFNGEYDPKKVYYLWHAVRDDRVQEEHLARDGHVLTAEEWDTREWGDGTYGGPPLRPRCRCSRSFVMPQWFSKEAQAKSFAGDEPLTELAGGGEPAPVAAAPPEPAPPPPSAQAEEEGYVSEEAFTTISPYKGILAEQPEITPPLGQSEGVALDLGDISLLRDVGFEGKAAEGSAYRNFVVEQHEELFASFWSEKPLDSAVGTSALYQYQTSGFRPMNAVLRGRLTEEFASELGALAEAQQRRVLGELETEWSGTINGLRRVFDAAPELKNDTYVYRHAMFSPNAMSFAYGGAEPVIGAVVQDRGFMSTSLGRHIFEKQTVLAEGIENSTLVRMRIRVPGGTKVVIMQPFLDEAELLLKDGTRLRVLSWERSGTVSFGGETYKVVEMEMEVMP